MKKLQAAHRRAFRVASRHLEALKHSHSACQASALESAYAEFNGLNLLAVCEKYGLSPKRVYRDLMDRRAARAAPEKVSIAISREQREIANRIVEQLILEGKGKGQVRQVLTDLLDSFETINRRVHPSGSCSQAPEAGHTAR